MNLKTLLLNPTTSGEDGSSLSLETVEFLINKNILQEELFLETQDGSPVWALWIENGCKTDIKKKLGFVVQRLSLKKDFSWAALWTNTEYPSRTESCLGRFGFLLSLTDFEQAIQSLSNEQYHQFIEVPKGGKNVLLKAFNKGYLDHADICLKNGWDINAKNSLGQTIVFHARDWETAKKMVEKGSLLNVRDTEGRFVSDNIAVWGHKNKSIFSEFLQLSANEPLESTTAVEASSQTKSISQEATHLISGMVGDLSRNRMGDFPTLIKKLNKIPNNNQECLNPITGKPVCEMVCDGLEKTRYGSFQGQERTLFLLRFCNNMFPHSVQNGWIDLNRPVSNFPQWTVRDHLLMTLSIRLLDGGKAVSKIPENFETTLSSWLTTSHLLPDVTLWLETFDPKNNLLKALKFGASSGVMEGKIVSAFIKQLCNSDVSSTVLSDVSRELEKIEEKKQKGMFTYADSIKIMRGAEFLNSDHTNFINYGVWSVLCQTYARHSSPELENLLLPVSLLMITQNLIQHSSLSTYGYTTQTCVKEFLEKDFFKLLKQDSSAHQWLEELNGTWDVVTDGVSLSQLLAKRQYDDKEFFDQCLTIRQQLVLSSALNTDETRKSACRRKI